MTAGLLFDFYGTLAEAVDWGPTFDDVLAARGLEVSPDSSAWTAFEYDGHEHLEHSRSRDHYVAWERERLSRLARRAGATGTLVTLLVDELYAAAKTYQLRVYDDVEAVLEILRARGVALAVCSNWDWDLPDVIDRLGLAAHFDAVVTSARVGARKPHQRIYTHALELLGLSPQEVVFVGDSVEPDVAGPLAHGMRAVHLARNGDAHAADLPEGASRVGSLAELPAFL